MDPQRMPEALLGPYRVLDLTTERGFLAGKLMGDMGADVIKVEPPGGDSARRLGPFYHDEPHPEKSLYWMAFNLNKRGITLDLETADGRELFLRLVKTADFVIESFEPGYMDRIGLGYNVLSAINPALVMTAITPFGQSGPYKDFKTGDLVNMGMGGFLFVTGDEDRPPLNISFPVSYCHAGAEAAASSAIAHYHRDLTGEGQFIDVSIQECIIGTLLAVTTTWDLNETNSGRGGPIRVNPQTGVRTQSVWPCKDGYVTWTLMGGRPSRNNSLRAMAAWMHEEDMASDWFRGIRWEEQMAPATLTQELYDGVAQEMGRFLMTKTTGELYERAVADLLLLAPVSTAKQQLESPQLLDRQAFVEVNHPELGGKLMYPGGFAKMSAWSPRISRKPPRIGEHNVEVFCEEMGLSRQELATLREAGAV